MNELNLPILSSVKVDNINVFIEYWSKLYSYRDEWKYSENIYLAQFTDINILQLFEWKNGSELSEGKSEGFRRNILGKLQEINLFKSSANLIQEEFLSEFESVTAVWKIFLLHTIKPNKYPIYDQHVHRAYNYIKGIPFEQIKNTIPDKEKLNFYFGDYLTFINSIRISDLKKMDEAFFAFGKLLNTGGYQRTII